MRQKRAPVDVIVVLRFADDIVGGLYTAKRDCRSVSGGTYGTHEKFNLKLHPEKNADFWSGLMRFEQRQWQWKGNTGARSLLGFTTHLCEEAGATDGSRCCGQTIRKRLQTKTERVKAELQRRDDENPSRSIGSGVQGQWCVDTSLLRVAHEPNGRCISSVPSSGGFGIARSRAAQKGPVLWHRMLRASINSLASCDYPCHPITWSHGVLTRKRRMRESRLSGSVEGVMSDS